MKNILITGGLGYIGSKFTEIFHDKYDITVFDTSFYNHSKTKENFKLIKADIRQIEKIHLEHIDVVVHMSELSNDPLGEFNPELTNEINHESTKKLLNLSSESGVKKFIYMSSASVYGFNENLLDEKSETNPLTQYALAKINNENYILNNKFNFETIILRNSTVFGFSNNLRLDLVINDLTFNAVNNGLIKLISDGSPKRPFVHVEDLCKLINIIILDKRNLDKELFNVGDNSLNYSIREISEIISELTKVENIEIGEKDPDQRSYYLSFDKLNKTFTNFKIEKNMEKGVNDLILNFNSYQLTGNERRLTKLNKLVDKKMLDTNLYWL